MEQTKPNYRRLIIFAVIILVMIGVLIIALDWHEVRRIIGKAQWHLVLPAFVFVAISYSCLSYSFVVLNRSFGIKLKQWDLFEIGFVSIVLGHIMSFAGVPQYSLRLLLMKSRGLAVGDILAPSVFDSYLNNLAMLTLFPIGIIHLFVSHSLSRGEMVGFGITVAVVVVVLILASAIIFGRSIRAVALRVLTKLWHLITHHNIGNSVQIFDKTLTSGVSVIRSRPLVIALLVALIVGDWTSTVIAVEFCFDALGNPIGLGVLVTGFAIGITAGVLSMVPGGLGVQEGSMAGIYALLGVPFEQAILAAILFRIVYYFVPFLVSLGFYRRLLSEKIP